MCEITLSTNAHHDGKITEIKFQGHISALICRRNELMGKSLLDLLPIKAWKYNSLWLNAYKDSKRNKREILCYNK